MLQIGWFIFGLFIIHVGHGLSQNTDDVIRTLVQEFENNLRKNNESLFMDNMNITNLLEYDSVNIADTFDQICRLNDHRVQSKIIKLKQIVYKVNNMYKQFEKCLSGDVPKKKYENFIATVTSKNTTALLHAMHELVYPNKSIDNLFVEIAKKTTLLLKYKCNTTGSTQLQIFNLINIIALAEIKGITIKFFAFSILEITQQCKY